MVQLRVGPIVRATDTTSVAIWLELSQACVVTLKVVPDTKQNGGEKSVSTRTVSIAGHYYAVAQLHGLQSSTWYSYKLYTGDEDKSLLADQNTPLLQCFRTLDDTGSESSQNSADTAPLRLVYGSCRRLDRPEDDTLNAFGDWLIQHVEQREQVWPHLLLMIGDQIYADEPPAELLQLHPNIQTKDGITIFTDFACQYEYVWTSEKGIRQVLATIPTYMIFDDHEIYNNWGFVPEWKEQMIRKGMEQLLVDGLVAYWVYQGWGNLIQSKNSQHPLLQIMQAAEKSGEDVIEELRACIKDNVYGRSELAWHYTIPTTPPIFVTNSRADRTATFTNTTHASKQVDTLAHIMGAKQTTELCDWMDKHDTSITLLVSSVPILLPPFIGLVEYCTGIRLWQRSPLRWIEKRLEQLQSQVIQRTGFDHWPIFTGSWHALLAILKKRKRDIIVLGGDVHFSYMLEGRRLFADGAAARLYQIVSSPFQNTLGERERRLIERQAFITRMAYGGLDTHVMPLQRIEETAQIKHDLLFNDTLGYVTVQLQQGGSDYNIEQEYMGIVEGQMVAIARTSLPEQELR